MANKNFQNYAVAGNNVALTYDNVNDTVTFDVNVDKTDVGLGNVDNTSDINKPISTLVQNALNLKEGVITAGTTAQYYRGDKTFQTLDKNAIGLGNVDNTTDLLKPISNATQTALNGKQGTISLTTTGSSGASTFAANVLNIPTYTLSGLGGQPLNANLTSITALTFASTSFVKMTAAGTFALDTNTYLTAESDTLASVTGRGNTTTNAIAINIAGFFYGGLIINSFRGSAQGAAITVHSPTTIANNIIYEASRPATATTFAVTHYVGTDNQIYWANTNASYNFLASGIQIVKINANGNLILQSGGTFTDSGFRLDVNGTARIQNQLTTTGSITAASAIARGVYMNQTLVAAANNDVLVGLDINPTFNLGAFTGVQQENLIIRGGNNPLIRFKNAAGTTTWGQFGANSTELSFNAQSGNLNFVAGNTQAFYIFTATRNAVLQNGGTFTDAGFRLDVVGADSRFNGIRAGLGAGQVASNTVFGNGALGSNVSGTGITAIGFQALRLSTGSDNTAIGYQALQSNLAGVNNIAIGVQTLNLNQGGSNNIGIGSNIKANVSGNSIIAIGRYALDSNTASSQVAIGVEAAKTSVSAFGITAIGHQALKDSTGSANTAVGTYSLNNNTTGGSNTAIGYNTLSGNFSGSIILGREATATANNQFVVGSSSVNAGAVTTATAAQTKTWDVIINGVAQKILLA